MNADIKKYYELHGCKVKGSIVLVPLLCKALDLETCKCKLHGRGKPKICSEGYVTTFKDVYVPDSCVYKEEE
jgi:uncharacterized cysteine cluster protein YcgN (CxxCxxCC family)